MISLVFIILLFISDKLSVIEAGVTSMRFQLTNDQPLKVDSADNSDLLDCAVSCSGAPGCSGYTFTKISNSESCQLLFDDPSSNEKNLVLNDKQDTYIVMERYYSNPSTEIQPAILDNAEATVSEVITTTTLSTPLSLTNSCNGQTSTLTSSSGSFTSDNYPAAYAMNLNCTWLIALEEFRQLHVTLNNIDLEDTADCAGDKINIFNGPNIFSAKLATKCGTSSNAVSFITTSNKAFIQFVTDGHDDPTHLGFKASYS